MKRRHIRTVPPARTPIAICAMALLALPALAPAQAEGRPERASAQGLTAAQWRGIRAAHEASLHAARPIAGGYLVRNPAQRWQTSFDGRGFVTRPDAGTWSWGLVLTGYGFAGEHRAVTEPAGRRAEQGRVTYRWDDVLEEWYVNDRRGLEHGFTLQRRPCGAAGSPLTLTLAVRGTLRPRVLASGRDVQFVDEAGATVLTYSGLVAFDADGKDLPATLEHAGDGLRIRVDERGARYPLTIDPLAQKAYLKASNTEFGDEFGDAVAVSGNTVVVGAYQEDSNATTVNGNQTNNNAPFSGAAYVFVEGGGGIWTQQAYLKPSNTTAGDHFGRAVAIHRDTIVIGAAGEDGPSNSMVNSGAAYVFVRNSGVWTQQAYLRASNAGLQDGFGVSVTVHDNTVVVGSTGEDSNATGVNGNQANNLAHTSGAAYVFVRSGTTWSQQAYLKASNTETADFFGRAVAVSGNTVVVGAQEEDSNATGVNGNQTNNDAFHSGAAYVFVRTGTSWAQQAYLKASNTDVGDTFGQAVAISGNTIVVGAWHEGSNATGVNGDQSDDSLIAAGAAYVFVRSGNTWSQQAYLKASNTGQRDRFGICVSISGNKIAIGAPGEDSAATGVNGDQGDPGTANDSGAAYVFKRFGSTWSQLAYLKASNTQKEDFFGDAIGISGDTVVVGARLEDSNATGVDGNQNDNSAYAAGAAYVLRGIPDLYVRDHVADLGSEPSDTEYPWTSPAIWVRNSPDNGLVHQNPIGGTTNTVYVRVRNRSCVGAPVNHARLKAYWAKASTGLSYPNPWNGTPNCSSSGEPMGNYIEVPLGKLTPAIAADGSTIMSFQWDTPEPIDYAGCGADQTHFCLLARLETPYGMTVTETWNLGANVVNNNDICWRNVTILGEEEGSTGFVMLSNYDRQAVRVRTRIDLGPGLPMNLPVGALQIVVTDEMMALWIAGGRKSSGLRPSPVARNTFDVLLDGASLDNLALAPNQHAFFQLRLSEKIRVRPGQAVTVNAVQLLEGTKPRMVGGQEFVVRARTRIGTALAAGHGRGCRGTKGKVPYLSADALPRVPSSRFALRVRNGLGFAPGSLFFAPSATPFRLSGCDLYVPTAVAQLPVRLNAAGQAAIGLPIPNNPTLMGISLHAQGMILDRNGTLFGQAALTNALELRLGN